MDESIEKMFTIKDRVVILTGGAGLLGREYTFTLAKAGAHVVVADINGRAAEKLAAEVNEFCGVQSLGVPSDISSKQSIKTMLREVISTFGRVDILVNNAALDPKFDADHSTEHVNSFEVYPIASWNKSLSVDLTGMFLCAQAVAPHMLDQGGGVIVNISSIYGLVGPDQRLYKRDNEEQQVFKPAVYSVTKRREND